MMARLALLRLFAILLTLLPRVQCAITFINPPNSPEGDNLPRPVYKVGDVVNITWTTDETRLLTIAIWQDSLGNTRNVVPDLQYLPNSTRFPANSSPLEWTVGIDGEDVPGDQYGQPAADLLISNVFFLAIYVAGDPTPTQTTVVFNISNSTVDANGNLIQSAVSSSVSGLATLSSSTSRLSSSTASLSSRRTQSTADRTTGSSADRTVAATNSATTSASGDSNNSTPLGLGLGLGLGIPLVLVAAGGVWLLLKKRRTRGGDGMGIEPKAELDAYTTNDRFAKVAPSLNGSGPPAELHSQSRLSELQSP